MVFLYKTLVHQIGKVVINDMHFCLLKKKYLFSELYKKAKEGGTPDTKHQEYYINGNIPFIKIDDLKYKHVVSNSSFINENGLKKSSSWLVPKNCILLSNGATIGEISITCYPVATKQGILGIIPSDIIETEYFYYFLKSKKFKKEINKITTKGTMDAAYIKDIDNIICYIEPKNMQIEYIKHISIFDNIINNEKKILSLYEKQKQYLLNKMFI